MKNAHDKLDALEQSLDLLIEAERRRANEAIDGLRKLRQQIAATRASLVKSHLVDGTFKVVEK